jgi:hypothetical protein
LVVECVVIVVFCVVLFGLLKTCQLFELYFWDFPVLGIRQRCPWMDDGLHPTLRQRREGWGTRLVLAIRRRTRTTADPYGMTNKKVNGKGRSRFLRFAAE